mmetsp:Transcript_45730/g.118204  ORF Transcript_45730/g.118204 Transcript_45730/m.118204 type:complete len:238 (+) Transcript_45730:561-1274(+)
MEDSYVIVRIFPTSSPVKAALRVENIRLGLRIQYNNVVCFSPFIVTSVFHVNSTNLGGLHVAAVEGHQQLALSPLLTGSRNVHVATLGKADFTRGEVLDELGLIELKKVGRHHFHAGSKVAIDMGKDVLGAVVVAVVDVGRAKVIASIAVVGRNMRMLGGNIKLGHDVRVEVAVVVLQLLDHTLVDDSILCTREQVHFVSTQVGWIVNKASVCSVARDRHELRDTDKRRSRHAGGQR